MYNGTEYVIPQYYTQSEIRDIVSYAADLFIDVIPEIDVPAHAAALIVAARHASPPVHLGAVELHEGCTHPGGQKALHGAPNCMGGTHGMVIPTNETMQYLRDILEEVGPPLSLFLCALRR